MVNFSNSVVTLLISGLFSSASFAAEFSLSSPDLQPGQAIKSEQYWNSFGCQGSNVRPQLKWQNAPKKAKSFAVTVYDNDAPTGSGFWHWVVHDIPLTSNSLSSTTLPKGAIEGNTDMGKPGYLGPCPPEGHKHSYTYKVYALDVEKLAVPQGATSALTGFFLHQHSLQTAEITVTAGPR